MADIQAGKPLITLLKKGTGVVPGGFTPIVIDGQNVTYAGNTTDGMPITINLIKNSGNPVPNGAITRVGNVFNARITDVTSISVNTANIGNVDNWSNIEIDVDDKNGNPITPAITKVGNTINLDISGVTPVSVNAISQGTIDNWDNVAIVVLNKNGNPITPTITKIGNNIGLSIAGTSPISVNGVSQGSISNWDNIAISVTDKNGSTITPTITKVGNNIGLSIAGTVPLTVNSFPSGTLDNFDPVSIDTFDKNGVAISALVTKTGNNIDLSIAGTSPFFVNAVQYSVIDNWDPINVNVTDKNGSAITPTVVKTGNTYALSIAGVTPISVNTVSIGTIANWDNIEIDVDDKNGNPITPTITKVGNTINLDIAGTHPVQINGGASIGNIPNWDSENIVLKDQLGNTVVPTSTSIVGSTVNINITNNPAPSGVAFKIAPPTQRTIYATGATPEDEGWRWQNGWWDYVPPTAPEKVAELDYSQSGVNPWYVLKQSLRVGSVTSTTRFVDVLGGQTWAATNNRNYVAIDKLTGLMFVRLSDVFITQTTWQAMIDAVAALSLTIDGVTYNDWYVPTIEEYALLFGCLRTAPNWADPVTGINIMTSIAAAWNVGLYQSATTSEVTPTNMCAHRADSTFGQYAGLTGPKTGTGYRCVPIRKCRNLITAS